ncbi:MAG TPA: zf-TFIIB domain-containing protein [Candidatus Omnitrophota bacterium]|jgi:Zn-finger nucleic acid-binding protein|nr:zf-TFIIB domain-containing protein [Candidatus Omnitrophota bacterium]
MKCPVCQDVMVVLELAEVEIDHCLTCGGIWLDSGELELLLDSETDRTAVLQSFRPAGPLTEKARQCPICLKGMEKVFCAGIRGPVRLDRCPAQHGIWFDPEELQDVLAAGSAGLNSRVLDLLKDMFGNNQPKEERP